LRIGRALDLGAAGIMLPQLQSAAEVREAVRYLRYPPIGSRGVALRTRGADLGALGHGEVVQVVNERLVGIVQIEAATTVADADEIAAMDEVDVLFVGPADLTHNLRIPGRFDEPVYQDALKTVVEACRRHGKSAGILVYEAAAFQPHHDLGFRFIGLGSEGSFVASGAAAMLKARPA
jgi:4-hydroxy-2-oxoheptanedioate aldolase